MKFDVKVITEPSIFSLVGNNKINSTDNFAIINNDPHHRDKVRNGKFMSLSKNTDAAAHEYGHMLGLADQYFDVYNYKDGYGAGKTADDYIITPKNYIGTEKNDLMGAAGDKGKVSDCGIQNLGNYILNDAKKGNKSSGKIQVRDASIGEVDNETKIKSGYQPPPIVVDENIKH